MWKLFSFLSLEYVMEQVFNVFNLAPLTGKYSTMKAL